MYHFFVSTMVGICPTLANALALGTDGEEAIGRAFKQQLNSSICDASGICGKIFEESCKQTWVFLKAIAKILDHIFRIKDRPTFHEGLVDAKSQIMFDSKLMLLEKCWAEFEEYCTKRLEKQQSFYTWFCKYHSEEDNVLCLSGCWSG